MSKSFCPMIDESIGKIESHSRNTVTKQQAQEKLPQATFSIEVQRIDGPRW